MQEQVLWGAYNDDPRTWIKIAGGTLRYCRAQMKERKRERGWCGLFICPKGRHPSEY